MNDPYTHDLVHYNNARYTIVNKFSTYYEDMCEIKDFKLEKIDYGYIHTDNVSVAKNWAIKLN